MFVQSFTLSFKRPVTAMDICQGGEWIWVGLASSDGSATVLALEDAVWDPITIMAVKQIHGFAITSLKVTPPSHPQFPAFLVTASADGSISITRYNIPNRIRKLFDWIVWLITQVVQLAIILIIIKVLSQYYPRTRQSDILEAQHQTETVDGEREKSIRIQTNFDLPEIISKLGIKASILGKNIKRKVGEIVELAQKWRNTRTESFDQDLASVSEEEVELVELAEVPEFPEETTATLARSTEHSASTTSQIPTRTETVKSQTKTEPHYKQTHHGMKPMSSFKESTVARATTTPTATTTVVPIPTSTTQLATSYTIASAPSVSQPQPNTTDFHEKESVVDGEQESVMPEPVIEQETSTTNQGTYIASDKAGASLDFSSKGTNQSQTKDQPISIEQSSTNLTSNNTSQPQTKTENETDKPTTVSGPSPTSTQPKGETGDLAGVGDSVGTGSTGPSTGTNHVDDETLGEADTGIKSLELNNTAIEDSTISGSEHHQTEKGSPPHPLHDSPTEDNKNKYSKSHDGKRLLQDTDEPSQSTQNGGSDGEDDIVNDDLPQEESSESEGFDDDSWQDLPHFDL